MSLDTAKSERIISLARDALAADERVLTAYLFGSFGRGDARADSDLDIAILFAEKIDARVRGPLYRLLDAVKTATGRRGDIIDGRTAPADLVHRILRDGRLLLDRDRSVRIAFEVARRNEYFDILPCLLEYRRGRAR